MNQNVNEFMEKDNNDYILQVLEASEFIKGRFRRAEPKLAIVLGSGLGPLASDDDLEKKEVIPYSEIPHFPQSAVPGHAGELILAEYQNHSVILMSGRTHFYEAAGIPGYNSTQAMKHITLPIRALKGQGIEALLLSNAAGGLNCTMKPPELMMCESVLNFSGANPLYGLNLDLLGLRFPPMGGDECNEELAGYLRQAAKELGIHLREGTYAMMGGPNYEFTARCRALRTLGADAVGMSTVPAIIVALHGYYSEEDYAKMVEVYKHQGGLLPEGADFTLARRLKVAAVSLISNVIGEDGKNQTSHEEVIENGKKGAAIFVPLAKKFILKYYG